MARIELSDGAVLFEIKLCFVPELPRKDMMVQISGHQQRRGAEGAKADFSEPLSHSEDKAFRGI